MTARYFIDASTGSYIGAFVDFPEDWAGPDGAVEINSPPAPPVLLRPLTPREFRDALIDNDILPDQVTAAIQTISDEKARAKALNAWEYPLEFVRTDPLIETISAAFKLTPETIDKMWKEAAG